MKNRFLLLFLGCMLCRSIFSDNITLQFAYDHKEDVCNGHSYVVPTVTSDDDEVTITCDSTLYNVDIVICDQWGNVMYHSTQTVGPNETILYVPNLAENSEKTTIDLYYGREHLKGIFDE